MLTIIPCLHIKEQHNLQDLPLSSKLKKINIKKYYHHYAELLYLCHRPWYMFVTKLVYVCHRVIISLIELSRYAKICITIIVASSITIIELSQYSNCSVCEFQNPIFGQQIGHQSAIVKGNFRSAMRFHLRQHTLQEFT